MQSPSHSFSKKIDLSVVLPVHNENPHIENILINWLEELRYEGISFEMIVVNDGSLDGTGRVLDKIRKDFPELRLVHQLNLGKDRAYRRGYEIARGQYILSISGNGRIEPTDFLLLWRERARGYLILTHRSHRLDGYFNKKLSSFLSRLARYHFDLSLHEPDCNFRLCLREVVEPVLKMIPLDSSCFQWSFTALVQTLYPGQVAEVMVPYRHRLERHSPFRRKSNLGTAWNHFVAAIKLKWTVKKLSFKEQISSFRRNTPHLTSST